MNVKLTLSVEEEVVAKAKRFAKLQGRSVSDLVESYLKLISASDENNQTTDSAKKRSSLRGVFKVDEDFDYKEELIKALSEKYLEE